MDKNIELEINTLITERILLYHSQLIKTGQIKEVKVEFSSVIPKLSHYSQTEHMQTDDQPINPSPL
jgi:hypothetical protein